MYPADSSRLACFDRSESLTPRWDRRKAKSVEVELVRTAMMPSRFGALRTGSRPSRAEDVVLTPVAPAPGLAMAAYGCVPGGDGPGADSGDDRRQPDAELLANEPGDTPT